MREWVLYHHLIGVGKVYVFDDYSQPPMQGVLQARPPWLPAHTALPAAAPSAACAERSGQPTCPEPCGPVQPDVRAQDLIAAGLVEYTFMLSPFNSSGNKQDSTYAECVRRYGRRHQFLGGLTGQRAGSMLGGCCCRA